MVQNQLQPRFLHDHDPLSFCGQAGLMALRTSVAAARGSVAFASVPLQLAFDDTCRIKDTGSPSRPLRPCVLRALCPGRHVLSDFRCTQAAVRVALLGKRSSPSWPHRPCVLRVLCPGRHVLSDFRCTQAAVRVALLGRRSCLVHLGVGAIFCRVRRRRPEQCVRNRSRCGFVLAVLCRASV